MGNTQGINIKNRHYEKNKTTNDNDSKKKEDNKTIKDNDNNSKKIEDSKNNSLIYDFLKDDEFWLDG